MSKDFKESKKLLQKNGLPTEFTSTDFKHFFIASRNETEIIGLIGLEYTKADGLLKSLVVTERYRGLGIGRKLVNVIEQYARTLGIKHLILLTDTAPKFFEKLGYHSISRNEVPEFIKQTAEFPSICPESSVYMQKSLEEII